MTRYLSLFRSFVSRRVMLLYPLAIVVFTALFIGLHYMANQVPSNFVAQKLGSDFRNYNLTTHNYPFSAFGSQTVLSNIGQNQYTECAVLLSVLASGDTSLRNAVLPRTLVNSDKQLCALLKRSTKTAELGGVLETRPLRSRYWWGARSVYSGMLRHFSVYQSRELIRNATALAYVALAVALMSISPGVFWLSSPLLIFGTLFSGATYYSEVVLGVPYLWAILAAAVIAALHAARIREPGIHLAIFCVGMVSAYLWLLDGHLILLISWLMMIGYFSSVRLNTPLAAVAVMIRHLFAFSAGFVMSAISGQLVKAAYLGIDSIWKPLTTAMALRVSEVGPDEVDLNVSIVFEKVWGVGYWWTGLFRNEFLWQLLLWGSLLAALTGFVIGLYRGLKGERRILYAMLVCGLIVLSVLARLFLLQNHSVIHAFFIGRYMFIPLAMAWVILLVALFGGRTKVKQGRIRVTD